MDTQMIAGAALGMAVGFLVLMNSKWRWKFPAYWTAGLLMTWAAYQHYQDPVFLKFLPIMGVLLLLGLLNMPKRQAKSKKRRQPRPVARRRSYR